MAQCMSNFVAPFSRRVLETLRGAGRVAARDGVCLYAVYEPAARFPGFGASADGERKGLREELATEGKKEGKKGGRKRETDEHCASG